ncbi:MAG: TIGR03960 family B12-binding radical SAM protein [Bacillota bacterium]|nr:TIGR03960 family B12-binding radical SAM protein [Bacillota bacterium]
MKLDKDLEKLLKRAEKPARYIGGEVNSVIKDPETVDVRVGFAFPDTYEIGMSYMGLQILYHILNSNDRIYCERVFAPAPDMEGLMREDGRQLFTLETFTPVKELDILGFTLQYELSFTNVLNMLDLAGIPIRSKERAEDDPVVLAGGPCAFNPEPLAEFIDAFLVGDGEELLEQVCLARKGCDSKEEFLKKICKMDGVYVPKFYEPVYKEDGTIDHIKKLYEDAPDRVKRAVLQDLDKAEFPVNNIVPFIDTVHDRSVVETFRGCTRGCRFCQAGMIYRPVRERKKETIKSLAQRQLANTGHEELSLLSLSTSDYSRFEELATELMELCKEQNVALSLPSLRLDSFSFKVLQEIQKYRKSGLTFAPEAGSQRLRDIINKNITEENIYSSVEQAIRLGWETIKLYFMAGLPGETEEDLAGIAEIARNIMDINFKIRGRKGGRFRVTVSVSNFVPKAHTPFQWEPQNRPEQFIEKHDFLSGKLRIKGVTFNYHETETSNLEAVFARGDRRICDLLERAFRLGCKFDGWSEHFNHELWQQAFEETGIEADFYNYRRRDYDEILPWDIIDPLITKEFLIGENEKAKAAQVTADCRQGCAGCGINRYAECFRGAELKISGKSAPDPDLRRSVDGLGSNQKQEGGA